MQKKKIVTILTDFGEEDGYVGAMKGVILSICPSATIIDISHYIPSYNILSASYVLSTYYKYFPENTLHLVVVDPGVGSERRILLVEAAKYFFIAPDNGLLTYTLHDLGMDSNSICCYEVKNKNFFAEKISNTFHGRDIFASVAAHLLNGISPENFGSKIPLSLQLKNAFPAIEKNMIKGKIIHIDRFGNIITNITQKHIKDFNEDTLLSKIHDISIIGLNKFYSANPRGSLISYIGSSSNIEIALVEGNAALKLHVKIGQEIVVRGRIKNAV